jgi:hypothetical protein
MKVNPRSGREGVNDNDEKSQDVITNKKGTCFFEGTEKVPQTRFLNIKQ